MGFIDEFKKFAMRGNMLDLAIGFTVGTAFSTVARSLVDNIIMPPISAIIGHSDFTNLFLVIKAGSPRTPPPYRTLDAAKNAGAITLNYGLFINNIVAFLIVALAMFYLIRAINRFDQKMESLFGRKTHAPGEPENKKCPYCLTTIPYQATRCPACTSTLDVPSSPSA